MTEIRRSLSIDHTQLDDLYRNAFPEEDLLPLVHSLLDPNQSVYSYIAIEEGALTGHVLFTECNVERALQRVSLLGPLAVSPKCQRQGVGTKLLNYGLENLKDEGFSQIFVLGDPSYYGRFGFVGPANVTPPCPIPDEWSSAWQSLCLQEDASPLRGKLVVPAPWSDPDLWGPAP